MLFGYNRCSLVMPNDVLSFIVLLLLDERLSFAGSRRFWLKELKDFFYI